MSETRKPAPEEGIIEKILGDARSQAKRALDNARRSREAEEAKAAKEAGGVREKILSQARRRAELLRSKETAAAQIETKRVMLRSREEAIGRVLSAIEEGLAEMRSQPEYREALRNLAAEAVEGIGDRRVVLRVAESDRKLADSVFVADVAERVGKVGGKGVEIEIKLDPEIEDGGCVATSADGRIVLNNTFGRRLERLRPALRGEIVNEVLGTNG
jgi:vacuolar-type H+-ATPase subunit E/Vma4